MEGDDDIMRHKLDLYRSAVQHPLAEVDFLQRVYRHHNGCWPTRLREDFAGTCAVAIAWVAMDENHRALAVERHGPTARWAQRRWQVNVYIMPNDPDMLLERVAEDLPDAVKLQANRVLATPFPGRTPRKPRPQWR